MQDLADKTEDLGQEGAMTEQEEVFEDIAELYNRYLTYEKYNYETEGAATITGAIAALAISTFVAIYWLETDMWCVDGVLAPGPPRGTPEIQY